MFLLAELLAFAERFDCLLLIDEAQASGVLGEQGRGVTDSLRRVRGPRSASSRWAR